MNQDYPLALPQGSVLAGQYVIEKVLGQGGFGITYKAYDHASKQYVAIKEFFPDSMATRAASTVIPFTGEREESYKYGITCFLQEAQTLAQFIGNDNIVRIYTYFEENGTAYFAMEYVEGESFDVYIKQHGGKLSFDEAAKILVPIMDALYAVHQKGIVHRDVTPDNIYITKDGTVKLLDFGAARYSLGDKSRSLDVVLKHGFAPKEQYTRKGKQGPFTDVYSLGATFYYAVTGKRPPDSVERMDEDELVPPSTLGADIGRLPEMAILNALNVQPQDRFQSMLAFKNAMYESQAVDAQEKSARNAGYINPAAQNGSYSNSYNQSGRGYGSGQQNSPYGSGGQGQPYGVGQQNSTYGNSGQQNGPYGNSGHGQQGSPYGSSGHGQQGSPYGSNGHGQQGSPYGNGGQQNVPEKKKSNVVPILLICAGAAVVFLILGIILIAALVKKKPTVVTTTEVVSADSTTELTETEDTTEETTEATTSSRETVDIDTTLETTTETTSETTTEAPADEPKEIYPQLLGGTPCNIANMALCATDSSGAEYNADYKGHKIIKYVPDGADQTIFEGTYVWNLLIAYDVMYFIGGREAYTCNVDGSNMKKIPQLTKYTDVDSLYVTKDYYIITRVDSDKNVSKITSVDGKSGAVLAEISTDYEGDSDAPFASRQLTFNHGYIYYILTSNDGRHYDSFAQNKLWRMPAGDMANSAPECVLTFKDEYYCNEIVAEGNYLYYLYGDASNKGRSYGVGMLDVSKNEILSDRTWDKDSNNFKHLVVMNQRLTCFSKNDGKVYLYSMDADPTLEQWTFRPVKTFETDESFIGLNARNNGYYFLSSDTGLQFIGLDGSGYSILSE